MYLMASTRCGISAKQLERELGVHYKTAWRMFNKIRNELMNEGERAQPLKGDVEIDETSWGGRSRRKLRTRKEQAE
jgi:transposase